MQAILHPRCSSKGCIHPAGHTFQMLNGQYLIRIISTRCRICCYKDSSEAHDWENLGNAHRKPSQSDLLFINDCSPNDCGHGGAEQSSPTKTFRMARMAIFPGWSSSLARLNDRDLLFLQQRIPQWKIMKEQSLFFGVIT